jgi:hypothetical protein
MSALLRGGFNMYNEETINKIKNRITELENIPKIDYNEHLLPDRLPFTKSDAIALSSPSGKMSKRAAAAAEKRLLKDLFNGYSPDIRHPDNIADELSDLHHALRLVAFVIRGMGKRKYPKIINPILEKYIKS